MSFTVKLAITFWVLGLGILFFCSVLGLAGISAMASVASVGIAIMGAGAMLGIVALLMALWKETL